MSVLARKEVLGGRAKFGGFGDGKEVPLVAMARAFAPGDFRSGYYRDQTLLLAIGEVTAQQFFAQLYADTDPSREPHSSGRQMPSHFATHLLDEQQRWRELRNLNNSAADLSPTAAQMPRLVGLAQASKLYRDHPDLDPETRFSSGGSEIAWGIIGNASCAQGMFWETVNAIGVLQAPAVITILDDGYGISVPNALQFTKPDISELLEGFRRSPWDRHGDSSRGYELHRVAGWDYQALVTTFERAARLARREHVPSLVHVTELTQPLGHSTSGSHERYKTPERLAWEREHDCLERLRRQLLDSGLVSEEQLEQLEQSEHEGVESELKLAWEEYGNDLGALRDECTSRLRALASTSRSSRDIDTMIRRLERDAVPRRRPLLEASAAALRLTLSEAHTAVADGEDGSPKRLRQARAELQSWRDELETRSRDLYGRHLHAEPTDPGVSPLEVEAVPAELSAESEQLLGFEILNRYFHSLLERQPRVVTFGEDVGRLGGVNQSLAGLQEIYGESRVSDTGIRETTIIGQGIGLALRGLRPIAEIQYLDYVLYALQLLSDDVASLHWRTGGRQRVPLIVRTRGHRLEGVWHSGSPMAGILNLVRGMHVVVPRDMTRAAGFYNTLLDGEDPAIVVEALSGYRRKERLPSNLAEIRCPLGQPEILRPGRDVTLVTYGTLCWIALDAASALADLGVDVEIIDVQTLLPFDVHGTIGESLQKTGRLLLVDEDVPGGTTAFMLQQVLEDQDGYHWLDSKPRTLSAKAHRPAYGTDGGYFSKPQVEDIVESAYDLMREADPQRFPEL